LNSREGIVKVGLMSAGTYGEKEKAPCKGVSFRLGITPHVSVSGKERADEDGSALSKAADRKWTCWTVTVRSGGDRKRRPVTRPDEGRTKEEGFPASVRSGTGF